MTVYALKKDTPVKNDAIDCKRATEALLREVVLHLCTFIVIVVNPLRATDQIYIREILKYCQTTKKKAEVIIVHNLLDVEMIHDIEQVIRNEVELIFNARPRQIEPVLSGVIDVRHFVQHDNQPYIVLSDRRSRQNLTEEPCQLELSEKLNYDNAGYFLRHEIEQWQPQTEVILQKIVFCVVLFKLDILR